MFPRFWTPSSRAAVPRGWTARIGSLVLLLQRSPLVKLLPEARVISTSGFTDALQWTVAVVAGLGAFDSVSGATEITKVSPTSGDATTIIGIAGDPLSFVWQATGTLNEPAVFQVSGDVPPGMEHTGTENSRIDSITGIPTSAGNYTVTVIAWRFPGFTGDYIEQAFTFNIENPPLPEIQTSPAGGNYQQGALVKLNAAQTEGRTFSWQVSGEPFSPSDTLLFPNGGSRRFRVAPAQDPGSGWRDGTPFDDAAWSQVAGGIGYDTTASPVNFAPHIASGGNLQTALSGTGKPTSVHLRLPFALPSGPDALSYFKLRVQCDDGFVAWLNGVEVAALNKPASLQWNSAATATVSDATAVTWREFNIPQHLGLLRSGQNLLAIQAMNQSPTGAENDFLFNCELSAGINATNSPWLVLTSLQVPQTGDYIFTSTNAAGAVSSVPAPVLIVPTISGQPESMTIASGETAQLNVTPEGSPPFSYQWYRGNSGDTSSPVSGAEEESYVSPPLTATESYWVRVTSPAGSVDSVTATVTVSAPAVETFTHWVAAVFTPANAANPAISGALADPDLDGLNNSQEYALGTAPQTFTAAPGLEVVTPGTALRFTATAAAGPGYAGRQRRYTVQSTGSLTEGPWLDEAGFVDLAGAGQVVTVPVNPGAQPRYYRLRVTLVP